MQEIQFFENLLAAMEVADVLVVALAEDLEEVAVGEFEELSEERRLEQDVGLGERVFVGVDVPEEREEVGQELEALGQGERRREVENVPCQWVQYLVDCGGAGLLAEVGRI